MIKLKYLFISTILLSSVSLARADHYEGSAALGGQSFFMFAPMTDEEEAQIPHRCLSYPPSVCREDLERHRLEIIKEAMRITGIKECYLLPDNPSLVCIQDGDSETYQLEDLKIIIISPGGSKPKEPE